MRSSHVRLRAGHDAWVTAGVVCLILIVTVGAEQEAGPPARLPPSSRTSPPTTVSLVARVEIDVGLYSAICEFGPLMSAIPVDKVTRIAIPGTGHPRENSAW
jgi:hypothetical protein